MTSRQWFPNDPSCAPHPWQQGGRVCWICGSLLGRHSIIHLWCEVVNAALSQSVCWVLHQDHSPPSWPDRIDQNSGKWLGRFIAAAVAVSRSHQPAAHWMSIDASFKLINIQWDWTVQRLQVILYKLCVNGSASIDVTRLEPLNLTSPPLASCNRLCHMPGGGITDTHINLSLRSPLTGFAVCPLMKVNKH